MIEYLRLVADIGAALVGPVIAAIRSGNADAAANAARAAAEAAAMRIAVRRARPRK